MYFYEELCMLLIKYADMVLYLVSCDWKRFVEWIASISKARKKIYNTCCYSILSN